MVNTTFVYLKEVLKEKLDFVFSIFITRCGEIIIDTNSDNLYTLCLFLKNNKECKFEQLIDVCCVDFYVYSSSNWSVNSASDSGFSRGREEVAMINYPYSVRFVTVYHFLSITNNCRITVRNFISSENLEVPSLCLLWPSANWYEREVFDFFGIFFLDHPFLRRILTDYNFNGFPLRKDFPLIGYKELKYDKSLKKCVYSDVTITQDTVNVRVVR